jgi:hypothetical protein
MRFLYLISVSTVYFFVTKYIFNTRFSSICQFIIWNKRSRLFFCYYIKGHKVFVSDTGNRHVNSSMLMAVRLIVLVWVAIGGNYVPRLYLHPFADWNLCPKSLFLPHQKCAVLGALRRAAGSFTTWALVPSQEPALAAFARDSKKFSRRGKADNGRTWNYPSRVMKDHNVLPCFSFSFWKQVIQDCVR